MPRDTDVENRTAPLVPRVDGRGELEQLRSEVRTLRSQVQEHGGS